MALRLQNRGHMRRALLLATLLAAPALGLAQTPAAGAITFTNTDADPAADSINSLECSSAAARVKISWAPTVSPPSATGLGYQLYASNVVSTTGITNPTTDCLVNPNPSSNIRVVKVGDPVENPSTLIDHEFATTAIAGALSDTPCALGGKSTIYLCVQGQVGGVNFGTSRGTMTLALTKPDTRPSLSTPIAPGNNALTPRWSGPTGVTNTVWFRVQAVSVLDPTQLPTPGAFDPNGAYSAFDPRDTGRHFSSYVTGTEARVAGLVNGVTYAVAVTGFTAEYNPGDPSNVGSGTPQVVSDFWQTYRDSGGREAGGCSSGLAGPIGLAFLAGALALARRRK